MNYSLTPNEIYAEKQIDQILNRLHNYNWEAIRKNEICNPE